MRFKGTFPAHPRNLQQITVKEYAWWPTQLSNNDWVWLELYDAVYEYQEPQYFRLYLNQEFARWVLVARTQ